LASSAADLSYGLPVTAALSTDFEVAPDQLRDAFVGDLQYVDERLHAVQVAVFQSSPSSSSSSSSETDQRNNTEVPLPQTQVHESWELFGTSEEVRETTDEVVRTVANVSDRQMTFQPFNEVAEGRRVTCDAEVGVCSIAPRSFGLCHRPITQGH